MSSTTRYSNYDSIAWVYKEYFGHQQLEKALSPLEKLLISHLPQKARILDLCCGSGELAQHLLTKGYQVTGLDGSETMLSYARENAPGSEFILSDARCFELPPTFNAVVSISGSLAHLIKIEELTCAFRNVYAALLENGLFVFNMYSEEEYQSDWNGSLSGDVKQEYAWAVQTNYHPEEKIGRLNFTVFQLVEGNWQRSDISVEERCYAIAEVQSALETVGFTEVNIYDAERDLAVEQSAGHLYFVCRK
ncbi:MAG TPA: class I SAM-dependent methyltransferase [Cyanobacteria bacterium UBA11369]|nr:class I SAM-dependent methyltransferase [Cyanobacteria bacterium UBA11371]HBE35044.1 class I SAM-dependent methyltransferase [Cyanobacteria bacterium UBA11368]HBE52480.1 class I SAM-dependent methyltransferase [Cyanobacteria bacterium UBA11369]